MRINYMKALWASIIALIVVELSFFLGLPALLGVPAATVNALVITGANGLSFAGAIIISVFIADIVDEHWL